MKKEQNIDVEVGTSGKVPVSRTIVTIEREGKGCASILIYSSVFIFIDVIRQVATYGMMYFNGLLYPVPQTQLVFGAELLKFAIFLGLLIIRKQLYDISISFLYLVPSLAYAINNNIYFLAMHYTTPPVWSILLQLRTIFLAMIYRLYFKRQFTSMQYGGVGLLIVSIALSNLSATQSQSADAKHNEMMTLFLAVVGSAIGAFGPVFTEFLFKNDKRSFTDKQFQLYMFGSVCTGLLYLLEAKSVSLQLHLQKPVNEGGWQVICLMVITLTSMVGTGISTAHIMKKLDNIVKLYTQSISNMTMTFVCFALFPDKFHLDLVFIMCLLLMFAGIFLYETSNLSCDWQQVRAHLSAHYVRLAVVVSVCVVCALVIFSYSSTSLPTVHFLSPALSDVSSRPH